MVLVLNIFIGFGSATLPLHSSALFRPVKVHQKVLYAKKVHRLEKSTPLPVMAVGINMSYASLQI